MKTIEDSRNKCRHISILAVIIGVLTLPAAARTIVCDGSYTYDDDVQDKTIEIHGNGVSLSVAGNMDGVIIECEGMLDLYVSGSFYGSIIAGGDVVVTCHGAFVGVIYSPGYCYVSCSDFYGPRPIAAETVIDIWGWDGEPEYVDDVYGPWGGSGESSDEIYVPRIWSISTDNGSVPDGSVVLKWNPDDFDLPGFTYDIYRGTNYTHALETSPIASDLSTTSCQIADHYTWNPEAPSVLYVVVMKYHGDEFDWCSLTTRKRYALAVGFSRYGQSGVEGLPSALNDASLFQEATLSKGHFYRSILLPDEEAKKEDVRQQMTHLAQWWVAPGDIFVCYFATHGSQGDWWKKSYRMSLYDADYTIAELCEDLSAFPSGAVIVPILMTCHSGLVLTDENSAMCSKTSGCGDNIAWIVSCNGKQYSVSGETYTAFGEEFLSNGWNDGFADKTLFGVPSYSGGNGDGLVSALELARYAHAFSRGKSQLVPSTVGWESSMESLLERTILGNAGDGGHYSRPAKPQVSATVATYDDKTILEWSAVPTATKYEIIRRLANESGQSVMIDARCSATRVEDKVGATIGNGVQLYPDSERFRIYNYHVRAVNPQGFGPWSEAVPGARGVSNRIPVPPPLLWVYRFYSQMMEESSLNYEAVSLSMAENGRDRVWQCYVAGLDPTCATNNFRSSIDFDEAGAPVIHWTPDLNEGGTKHERDYIVQGKTNLVDKDWGPTNEATRFFRVKVQMPE